MSNNRNKYGYLFPLDEKENDSDYKGKISINRDKENAFFIFGKIKEKDGKSMVLVTSKEEGKIKGYLFPNDYKEHEKQPDYKGKVVFDSEDHLMAGWKKEKDGKDMITLSLTHIDDVPGSSGFKNSGDNSSENKQDNTEEEKSQHDKSDSEKESDSESDNDTSEVNKNFGDIFDSIE